MARIDVGDNVIWIVLIVSMIFGGGIISQCAKDSPAEEHKREMATKNWCILNLRQQKAAKDTLTFLSSRQSDGSVGYYFGSECRPYALPDSVTR
jgi:hypothetical protein